MNVHVTCGACGITYEQEVGAVVPCCGACGSTVISVAEADPKIDNLPVEDKRTRLINLMRLLSDSDSEAGIAIRDIERFNAAEVANAYRQVFLAAKAAKAVVHVYRDIPVERMEDWEREGREHEARMAGELYTMDLGVTEYRREGTR